MPRGRKKKDDVIYPEGMEPEDDDEFDEPIDVSDDKPKKSDKELLEEQLRAIQEKLNDINEEDNRKNFLAEAPSKIKQLDDRLIRLERALSDLNNNFQLYLRNEK